MENICVLSTQAFGSLINFHCFLKSVNKTSWPRKMIGKTDVSRGAIKHDLRLCRITLLISARLFIPHVVELAQILITLKKFCEHIVRR